MPHIPPSYTSNSKYDVGIHDEYGLKEFNPPSLRGISQRNRFFHDNRAQTLIEVFRNAIILKRVHQPKRH